jgi:hypothetical protein
VRSSVSDSFPDADVSGCVVWINMLDGDTEVTARESARIIADPRFRHFHDPERQLGRVVGQRIGAEGKVAWDIYLFFAEGAEWVEDLPPPTDWIHQLSASWADPARLRFGDGLVQALRALMHGLTD